MTKLEAALAALKDALVLVSSVPCFCHQVEVGKCGPCITARNLKDAITLIQAPDQPEPDCVEGDQHGFLCGCERCHELRLDAQSEPEPQDAW